MHDISKNSQADKKRLEKESNERADALDKKLDELDAGIRPITPDLHPNEAVKQKLMV